MEKPHWKVSDKPEIITSANEVLVSYDREVKRFKVHLRRGAQGLKVKLTDHSSDRVRRELEKAGEGSTYAFDYQNQEAVIYAQDNTVTLAEWRKRKK